MMTAKTAPSKKVTAKKIQKGVLPWMNKMVGKMEKREEKMEGKSKKGKNC